MIAREKRLGGLLAPRLLADWEPVASSQHHLGAHVSVEVYFFGVQLSLRDLQVASHRGPLVFGIAQRPAQGALGERILAGSVAMELAHVQEDRLGFPVAEVPDGSSRLILAALARSLIR